MIQGDYISYRVALQRNTIKYIDEENLGGAFNRIAHFFSFSEALQAKKGNNRVCHLADDAALSTFSTGFLKVDKRALRWY